MKITPVILSGGSGTRLWPLSRAALPKQLLALTSEHTMLQETLLRLSGLPDITPPLIVCGNEHRFLIAEQLRQIGTVPLGILLEPEGRNTAPAVAAAAYFLLATNPDAVMLVLPADHVIDNVLAFHAAILRATRVAAGGALVTFGIVPSCPETGYGYIRCGNMLADTEGCFSVARFVEKPDLATAERFVRSGEYFWNSGMYLFHATCYLEELKKLRPEIALCCDKAVRESYRDLDFCRLHETEFSACPSDSIDYSVIEHTRQAVLVPTDIGWSDVGSWAALSAVQQKDNNGNVLRGDVYVDEVTDCLIHAESRLVTLIGVSDLVVVETADAVLISDKKQVQRVKKIVEHLQKNHRCEHINHTRVYRPWGHYEGIDAGDRFQVKHIMVNPGEKLSLQMHHHRAEHWIVISGTARVTCGELVKILSENESTYIPIGIRHRLENPGKIALHLIEVQSGSYLGEDDIVRFEDMYQRI